MKLSSELKMQAVRGIYRTASLAAFNAPQRYRDWQRDLLGWLRTCVQHRFTLWPLL